MPKKRNTGLPKIKQLPSGAYHATVYSHTDPDGKRHYESFTNPDYSSLLVEVAQFKADKKRSKTESNAHRLTLGEAMVEFTETRTKVLAPDTYRLYQGYARNHFKKLQNTPIDEITQVDIQVEINNLAAIRSSKTVSNVHGFISAVFSAYRPSFALKTTLPQEEKTEIVIPSEDDIVKIFEASAGTVLEIPILLAACCGMRRSEICALKWSNINFKKNTITIDSAVVIDAENKFVKKTTKTVSGTRTIRMFPIVSEALKAHREANPDTNEYIAPRPNIISNQFPRMLKKHGIPHYRFHDLRHYTVSVMISLNVPNMYIADYIGHKGEELIKKVYGHIMASKKSSVEDQMQQYFSAFVQK